MTDPAMQNENGAESHDERADDQQQESAQPPQAQGGPEPPASWNAPYQGNTTNGQGTPGFQQQPGQRPRIGVAGTFQTLLSGNDAFLFESGRKYQTAAQICAIVSLFIGGILLSCVAIVLAVIGYRKYIQIQPNGDSQQFKMALMRSGKIAIGMCAIALVLNVISFVALYPLVMEMMQTGDLSIFGIQPSAPAGSGTSTWG